MTSTRAPILYLSLAMPACSGAGAPPPGGGPGGPPVDPGPACTLIGCENGFRASLESNGPLSPGHYTVDVEADGSRGSYEVDIPLPPCDTRGKYSGELAFRVGESGCALPPDQHTLIDLRIEAAPRSVKVRVSRPGAVLADVTLAPVYAEHRPNGPSCEPVCVSAGESIVFTAR